MSEVSVRDHPVESRYEVFVDAVLAGFTEYRLGVREITFFHTEVFPEFGGRGVGGQLAVGALSDARDRDLAVIPECPFIRTYQRKHPDWAALVPERRRAEFHL